ncbi:homologous-pairing protein 2 homolog [Planococcus citri]|uniref:homologous-pairing protein 2 homolog n=1 Tax=Planococcus citri TaxID=170843 RepID=UPI0031F8BA61
MSKEKQAVLSYLEKVNRPYSANDVVQNLHKEIGKAAIQKALDQLVTEKKVNEKIYGKQKVYSVVQKDDDDKKDVNEELRKLETQILEKNNSLQKAEQQLKQNQSQLNKFQSALTTEDAIAKRDALKSELEKLETKYTKLSQNTVLISETDRKKIMKKHETVVKEYKKRKRICMEMINSILDSYPKSKAALIEEIDLELDDETNTPPV